MLGLATTLLVSKLKLCVAVHNVGEGGCRGDVVMLPAVVDPEILNAQRRAGALDDVQVQARVQGAAAVVQGQGQAAAAEAFEVGGADSRSVSCALHSITPNLSGFAQLMTLPRLPLRCCPCSLCSPETRTRTSGLRLESSCGPAA